MTLEYESRDTTRAVCMRKGGGHVCCVSAHEKILLKLQVETTITTTICFLHVIWTYGCSTCHDVVEYMAEDHSEVPYSVYLMIL